VSDSTVAPVIAGSAVGIALIVLFASIFSTFDRSFADNRNKIDISIHGLKDTYASGERMALTIHIRGYSTVCDSSPSFMIIDSDSGDITHRYNGYPFTVCPDGFHSVDRVLTTEGPDNQLGDIVISESGKYRLRVGQYGETVEKEFSVMNPSGIELTINGLKDTYKVGETIPISATQKGGGCSMPEIVIMDENQQIVLVSKNDLPILCPIITSDERSEFSLTWAPSNHGKPIVINQTGTYTLVAQYETERIERQFTVIQ